MRLPAPLVLPLAGVLLLSGCAATPTVDEHALAAWQAEQETATETEPDVIGVLTDRIAPGGDAPTGDRPGVRVQFPTSHDIERVELSCFGNGHMRGVLRIESSTASGSFQVDELACRDSPRPIRLTRLASTDVDAVAFGGDDSDRPSAWRLVIVGVPAADG